MQSARNGANGSAIGGVIDSADGHVQTEGQIADVRADDNVKGRVQTAMQVPAITH